MYIQFPAVKPFVQQNFSPLGSNYLPTTNLKSKPDIFIKSSNVSFTSTQESDDKITVKDVLITEGFVGVPLIFGIRVASALGGNQNSEYIFLPDGTFFAKASDLAKDKIHANAQTGELLSDEQKRISVIGTTNNPENVDSGLIKNFIKMYIGPADFENTKSILEYYLEDYAGNLDIEAICQQLKSNPNGEFSNNQIKTLCNIIKRKQMDNESIVKFISTIKPEITNKNLERYKGGHYYDNNFTAA